MTCIRGVIFDMDGVLIDAREWHYLAFNKALEIFGLTINKMDHLLKFDGLPTKLKLTMLSERGLVPWALHPLLSTHKQMFTQEIANKACCPNDLHLRALSTLSERGYKLAVASNSVSESVLLMLRKANLLKYLEFTLSNEDVCNAKPDPEIYNLAIKRLGLSPEECVIVEDNPYGVEAATSAGAHVLKVNSPSDVSLDRILNFIRKCNDELADKRDIKI